MPFRGLYYFSCFISSPPIILSWLDLFRALRPLFLKSAPRKSNHNKQNCSKYNLIMKCEECTRNYSMTLWQRKKDADFGFDGFNIVTNILSDDHLKLHWDTGLGEMDRQSITHFIIQKQIKNKCEIIHLQPCP